MLKKIMFVVALGLSAALLPGCALSQKGGAPECCECPNEAEGCCSEEAKSDCCCK